MTSDNQSKPVVVEEQLVSVDNVHQVPTGKIAHYSDDRGLFYIATTSNEEKRNIQKPFAEYDEFDECVSDHQDKDNPEAYCAQIHYNATGEWPSEKLSVKAGDEFHVFGPNEERSLDSGEAYCKLEEQVFHQFDENDTDDKGRRLCPFCSAQLQEYDKLFQLSDEKAATPEGVPEEYEYLPPGKEPPEGHDVVQSPHGAEYISPDPVEEESGDRDLPEGYELGDFNEDILDERVGWSVLQGQGFVGDVDGLGEGVYDVSMSWEEDSGQVRVVLEDRDGEDIMDEDGENVQVFTPDDIDVEGRLKEETDEYGRPVGIESFEPPEPDSQLPEEFEEEFLDEVPTFPEAEAVPFSQTRQEALDYLEQYHDEETVEELESSLKMWGVVGYADSDTDELWAAAMAAQDSNEPPSHFTDSLGNLKEDRVSDLDEDVMSAAYDLIQMSQAAIEEEFGESVEVHRAVSEDVAENHIQKNDDGSVTVKPQPMESWSYESTSAKPQHGSIGLEFSQEFEAEDFMFFGPFTLGDMNNMYHEATLGHSEPYTVEEENILDRMDITKEDEDNELYRVPLGESIVREEEEEDQSEDNDSVPSDEEEDASQDSTDDSEQEDSESSEAKDAGDGLRYQLPDSVVRKDFPDECRACGENIRMQGNFMCPECHPDVEEGEEDEYTLVTEKVDLTEVARTEFDNPSFSKEDVEIVDMGDDWLDIKLPNQEVVSFSASMPKDKIQSILDNLFRQFGTYVTNMVARNVMQNLPELYTTVGGLIGLSDEDEVEEYLNKASSGSPGDNLDIATVSQPVFGQEQTGVSASVFDKSATPEGVPEDAEYVPPGQEPPEEAEVVESPHGATYVVDEDSDEDDDSSLPDPRSQEYGYDEYDVPDPDEIEDVDLDLDVAPEFGERTEESILRATGYLQDKGLLDGAETVGGEPPPERLGVPFASFDPGREYVFVDPQQVSPEMVGAMADQDGLAGDSIEDVVSHETVHSLHWDELSEEEAKELTQMDVPEEEQEWLEENISKYSAKNGMEVVAEIGSLLLKGEDVPDRALELYDKYNGPEL